jgi:hypothetical protein
MTMTSGPSRSSLEAPTAKAEPAQRDDPQIRQKSEAFRDRLEKLTLSESGDAQSKDSLDEKSGQDNAAVRQWKSKDEHDRHDGYGGGATANASTEFARSVAMAQATLAEALPSEQLARIVAALEELIETGANAEYQLSLPAGATTVEGAVIGRDPTGKLHIQLLANAAIPPAAIQQLQAALRQKLTRKNAALGKISVQVGKADAQR